MLEILSFLADGVADFADFIYFVRSAFTYFVTSAFTFFIILFITCSWSRLLLKVFNDALTLYFSLNYLPKTSGAVGLLNSDFGFLKVEDFSSFLFFKISYSFFMLSKSFFFFISVSSGSGFFSDFNSRTFFDDLAAGELKGGELLTGVFLGISSYFLLGLFYLRT